jgi:hypothetical protein
MKNFKVNDPEIHRHLIGKLFDESDMIKRKDGKFEEILKSGKLVSFRVFINKQLKMNNRLLYIKD